MNQNLYLNINIKQCIFHIPKTNLEPSISLLFQFFYLYPFLAL